MQKITKQQAIDKLRTATSVAQWNEIREEFANYHFIAEIDASGLIVEVLGKDAPQG